MKRFPPAPYYRFWLGSPALAQQKTVKACQDEWRANKATTDKGNYAEKAT
jgi:hypothetical protein